MGVFFLMQQKGVYSRGFPNESFANLVSLVNLVVENYKGYFYFQNTH